MSNISPLLRKGAILSLDPNTGVSLGTIMLQYNPDNLTRSLKPQPVGEEPDRTEILRLKGPPIETIKGNIEIDATDQLAAQDPTAMQPRHPAAALASLSCWSIRRAPCLSRTRPCHCSAPSRSCPCSPR